MSNRIPIFRPKLPTYRQLEKYILKIDSSREYTNFGPLNQDVRSRFSDYLGLPIENIVTCSNATLGIEGAISTSGSIGTWGLPAWTFSATAAALNQSKGIGKFLDVDNNWRVQLDEIVDAAASFDGCVSQEWDKFPQFAGILSFHATKVLPSGEGGLFFSNSLEWSEKFKSWTCFGMKTGRVSTNPGTNAKLSEYHAAVLLASFDNWTTDREMWLEQISRANSLATKYGYISTPQFPSQHVTPYWIVQHDQKSKLFALKEAFHKTGIETRAWWEFGCHQMPAYKHFERDELTNTNRIAGHTLGLPFWIDMDETVWNRLENAFQSVDFK
jgi:dTDP-4-amino-4,6-dideoxygalactose transaminase